jgi:diguanylate cyclase (GGDEF)-like protein
MAATRTPAYLTLMPDRLERRSEPGEPIPFPTAAAFTRDSLCDVASQRGVLDRLALVGDIAPNAPLSFVVVKLDGLAELNTSAGREAGDVALCAIADEVRSITRPTDLVGRFSGTTFGIVLQGAGATAAAAVQARLNFRLSRLPVMSPPLAVRVSAATGTGVNSAVLPAAALDSFAEAG